MSDVTITPEAMDDMSDHWRSLARRASPDAADRQNAKILESSRVHAMFPNMAPRCEGLGEGLRSFPVGPVIVFYRTLPDGIEVVRVLQGARDWQSLLGGED